MTEKEPEQTSTGHNSVNEYGRVHRRLLEILHRQTRILDRLIHCLSTGEKVGQPARLQESKEVMDTILLMIQGLGVSVHSIIKLNDDIDMSVRDCFGIARSVSEGAINVAYIVAGGPDVAR